MPESSTAETELAALTRENHRLQETVAELRHSKGILESILEHAAAPIYLKDADGRYLYANQCFEDLSHMARGDLVGRDDFGVFTEPVARLFREQDQAVRSSGRAMEFEETVALPDGELHFITHKFPLRDQRGEICAVGGYCTDITERKRAAQERQKLQQQLHRVQKLESVGLLAGGIAHDFNNILGAILGNIELALIGPEREQRLLVLNEAKQACLRAQTLTQQLLTFAKGGEPIKRTASIEGIVRDTADFVLRGSATRCRYELDDEPLHADVDPGQFSQVIQNIILNAQDAMAAGGVVQVGMGRHRLDETSAVPLPAGDYVRVDIRDSGPGIPAENLQRIFDPYFTTKPSGNGLGLAICHSTITKHGGHLAVASVPDQGATFTIYLPAAPGGSADTDDAPQASERRGVGRVLFMDDDAMMRDVALGMLRSADHEVLLANDGREAIALFEEAHQSGRPIDVVILDLTVPGGLGGLQAMAGIAAIDPEARVIVTSGYSTDPVLARYREHGFCGTIAKPFQLHELLRVVADAMAAATT